MTRLWIKLYLDLLDDDKTGTMPDWLFQRFILFLLGKQLTAATRLHQVKAWLDQPALEQINLLTDGLEK